MHKNQSSKNKTKTSGYKKEILSSRALFPSRQLQIQKYKKVKHKNTKNTKYKGLGYKKEILCSGAQFPSRQLTSRHGPLDGPYTAHCCNIQFMENTNTNTEQVFLTNHKAMKKSKTKIKTKTKTKILGQTTWIWFGRQNMGT